LSGVRGQLLSVLRSLFGVLILQLSFCSFAMVGPNAARFTSWGTGAGFVVSN
jgi:hypothetical protein